jgi:serine protease
VNVGPRRLPRARAALAIGVLALALGPAMLDAPIARAEPFARNEVVVSYAPASSPSIRAGTARALGASDTGSPVLDTRVLHLNPSVSVTHALERLRREPGVRWAVPDYIAHAADVGTPAPFVPNNPGDAGTAGGWTALQWNFDGPFGVGAPQAWGNLISEHANGGNGVIVAVLDTGIAYRNVGRFRRSPGFGAHQFVKGYDFVDPGAYPVDHNGHGTFVAGEIAEATNNGVGLTGLAYGARLMPVRVLNSEGEGEASTIARGVYFAVKHGAQVINLSLEFGPGLSAQDIPELIGALSYAHRRGVVVVAAAGNEGNSLVDYPARAPGVIAVGATTEHGCLASYSNYGAGLALVAPGGGPDAEIPGDPDCEPQAPSGRDIYQETFTGLSPLRFGLPSGYEGTSMASPEVAATAALIIASGVLGKHPTPAAVRARLMGSVTPLGTPAQRAYFAAGLLNAAAATAAPGAPSA